jgi:hypothetical protein
MPLADIAEFKPDVLLRNMLGRPFFIRSLRIANLLGSDPQNQQKRRGNHEGRLLRKPGRPPASEQEETNSVPS